MGSNNIIVREYLLSLKEDGELDYLFPILLNIMGFRIVSTPKESKGQSQYGKDVVAIRKDEDGIEYRYFFELKGYKDRDISAANFAIKDGIQESIIESIYTAFNDNSIPGFNKLPIKIILVHNGTLKTNFRVTFEGFITKLFKTKEDGEFERWDIFHLTDLFSKHLFNEYLFTDYESLRLFKRTLVLLDAPENNFRDFKNLIDLQIKKATPDIDSRRFDKFFATQCLLATVIRHYSIENDNLESAKQCITYLLLKTWAWVLKEKLENRKKVVTEFTKLTQIHFKTLDLYFKKTFAVANVKDGLFSEVGGPFEEIGNPLRCFDYLNYLVYYCEVRLYLPKLNKKITGEKLRLVRSKQKDLLMELIENNEGCYRPLIDCHSITVINVIAFFLKDEDLRDKDIKFLREYIAALVSNIIITKSVSDRFPLLTNDEQSLVNAVANKDKSNYEDRSSLLITILFEIAAVLRTDKIHGMYKSFFDGKINLQTAYPKVDNFDIEQLLFERHFDEEFYVETNISLGNSHSDFVNTIIQKIKPSIAYRTDDVGMPYLRVLAHIYFKNEFFPDTWRLYLT